MLTWPNNGIIAPVPADSEKCCSDNKKLVNRIKSGFACHKNFLAFLTAIECAAAGRGLISNELILAEYIGPIWDDVTMTGAAYGVLGNGQLRSEAA